jgi:hypothetical protein
MTDPYRFGPCVPWDVTWTCQLDQFTNAAAVSGTGVAVASEILYHLTAQRFGLCEVTLRPCRRSCYGMGGFPWSEWWEFGRYPNPFWFRGSWFNLGCAGGCADSCSCPAIDEAVLPGPVYDVTEVKLDGVVLVKGTDYRIDDYRKLVRLGGNVWPVCQDLNLEDTEENTWSATVQFGTPVPELGKLAVGELAVEVMKYVLCDDTCALPQGVVDISRQGISMTVLNVAELFKTGFINLRMCDMFIKIANPEGLTARAHVYDLDNPQFRITGTTP